MFFQHGAASEMT